MSLSVYERAALALKPTSVDLQPVLDAIAELNSDPVDLQPVLDAIASIELPDVDLGPIQQSIQNLAAATDLDPVLQAIQGIDLPQTDLNPVLAAIDARHQNLIAANEAIQTQLGDLDFPEVDLSGVQNAISVVQVAVDSHRGEFDEFITALAGA